MGLNKDFLDHIYQDRAALHRFRKRVSAEIVPVRVCVAWTYPTWAAAPNAQQPALPQSIHSADSSHFA
jgi:hypothetical protein